MPTPPKHDPVRGHRGRGPRKLPAEGRSGPTPAWPLPGRKRAGETQLWRDLWKTPQAVAWEQLGWTRTVARYCRLVAMCESAPIAALHAQATALEDRLGLTPKAMRLLLWEIATDELAEKREAKQAAADVRERVRAVD